MFNFYSTTPKKYFFYDFLLETYIKSKIPKYSVKNNKEHWFLRLLHRIFKKYENFGQTIYPKVYLPKDIIPSSHDDEYKWQMYLSIICHEYVHLYDRKRMGWFFYFLYFLPQIFAIFGLLSFFSLWFLPFFLFLLPIPSIGRAYLEFRGYRASLLSYYWMTGELFDLDDILDQFTKGNYYFQ